MSLKIRFQGGQRAGDVVELDDGVERIVIGRDPERCHIAFPPDETQVGREHLRRAHDPNDEQAEAGAR